MTKNVVTSRHRAESLAATLPPLLVAARRVAATVAQGVHGRRRVGQGESFWQFRQYEVGDPPQLIDWRQSAKSDRVFVREMEWEAAQSTWIWRDASASMNWRSRQGAVSKLERANLLALALAVLLVRGGEHVALMGAQVRPISGQGALNQIAALLEEPLEGESLPAIQTIARHSQLVVIGDFLSPLEETAERLRYFAARRVRGHILQILDPAEESLPYEGRVLFEGMEREDDFMLSRVEAVRSDYVARMAAHIESLKSLARNLGWTYSHHRTDGSAQAALLALFMALSETTKQ